MRKLDRIPSVRTDTDWLAADLFAARPTAYDKLQNAKIVALTKRVAALEGKTPTPPTPTPPAPASTVIFWQVKDNLDQQQTGMCVGYGWSDLAQCAPKVETIVDGHGGDDETSTPDAIYDLARKHDGAVNIEDPQGGASVKGGAQASIDLGFIAAYHFCNTPDEIKQAIAVGPVVMGTDWLDGMFTPDASGRIHATGAVAGGHCYLLIGYDPTTDLYRIRNSWGAAWGVGGDAFISAADLATLFNQQGDAVLPTKA